MRFQKIEKFGVDDLSLDEANYRFKAAADQTACVSKIYFASPSNFKNMMTSIAQEDLGEDLLVYQCKKENIVLDGNRRLAALKVLHNPDKYAPTVAIRDHAETLIKEHKVSFVGIRAQTSGDKSLILRTVYERHAAGQGKSRIGWSAYGAARFRYDQQIEEGNDWYSLALLLETERRHEEWTDFLDSSDYSHEVFRRIFKAALDKGVISQGIFSGRNQRIKTNVDKKLLADAIKKTVAFLTTMKNKDISLSRSGKYADKASVDEYISQFSLSPDNVRSKPPASAAPSLPAPNSSTTASAAPSDGAAADNSAPFSSDKKGNGIDASDEVSQRLTKLKSYKLSGLYRSLCTVSLQQHPQLLYVGAWSFFETLASLDGKKDGTSFDSYFGSKISNNTLYDKGRKKDFKDTLDDINKKGNANKHSGTSHSTTATQLKVDFITLEPFIIDVIDVLIANSKKDP